MIMSSLKRISAGLLAAVLLITLFGSCFVLGVKAIGEEIITVDTPTVDAEYTASKEIATIRFTFTSTTTSLTGTYDNTSGLIGANSKNWEFVSDTTRLVITHNSKDDIYNGTLSNVKFIGNNTDKRDRNISFMVDALMSFDFNVASKYFIKTSSSSGSGTPDTPDPKPESKITIENVILYDSNNKEIDSVNKDSKPFKISVLFQDSGLTQDDFYGAIDDSYTVFWDTEKNTGFDRPDNTKGKLTLRTSMGDGIPHFRADFDNVTFNEKDQNLNVKVRYMIDGNAIDGSFIARIPQAKIPEKEEESKEEKISPLKPYIIVNQYSYGEGQIQAGSEFTLELSFKNTSSTTPLENIVMTVKPSEDLSIASASNSIHVPNLSAGGSLSHSVSLQAKPTAKVGSAEIEVEFTYQYIDTVNKKREEGTKTEKIAIPITQIDRFSVDPVKEIGSYVLPEEDFYITISFINRGKSPTYNITASATSKSKIESAPEHFGNLEPGKSGELELTVRASEPGDLTGEIIVQYEDENTNQKEIKIPFSTVIEAPYMEENPFPGGFNPDDLIVGPTGPSTVSIILYCIGGLLLAVPIIIYFAKRAKQKDSEDIYEDF